MSPDVPASYRKKIKELEDELNRSICAYPTDDGSPCKQWPVSDEGRCHQHTGKSIQDGLTSDDNHRSTDRDLQPSEPSEEPSRSSSTETDSEFNQWNHRDYVHWLSRSIVYWLMLVVFALSSGAASGYFFVDTPREPATKQPEKIQINTSNPDFSRIRQLYRDDKLSQVRETLRDLAENHQDKSVRGTAYYYRFVFQQNQQNYEEALSLAREYLKKFNNHPRRAEVIYGAWYLTDRYLNRDDLAQQYKDQLQDEFPESVWNDRISS